MKILIHLKYATFTKLCPVFLVIGGLISCKGEPDAICGTPWSAPASMSVELATSDNTDLASLCQSADVMIKFDDGRIQSATRSSLEEKCIFYSESYWGTENNDIPMDLEIHLSGYKSSTIEHANDMRYRKQGECTINWAVELEVSTNNCTDGYSDQGGACKTRAGCIYPLLEEPIGQSYYYEYQCVETCAISPSERPALCAYNPPSNSEE